MRQKVSRCQLGHWMTGSSSNEQMWFRIDTDRLVRGACQTEENQMIGAGLRRKGGNKQLLGERLTMLVVDQL